MFLVGIALRGVSHEILQDDEFRRIGGRFDGNANRTAATKDVRDLRVMDWFMG